MQYIAMMMNHDDGDISLRPQDPYWMDMMHQVLKCSNIGCSKIMVIIRLENRSIIFDAQ